MVERQARRGLVGELVADEPVKWKLSPAELARFWIGLSAVFYALSAVSYYRIFIEAFGPKGDVMLFVAIGTACLIAGVLKYRANEQTGL